MNIIKLQVFDFVTSRNNVLSSEERRSRRVVVWRTWKSQCETKKRKEIRRKKCKRLDLRSSLGVEARSSTDLMISN